MGRIRSLFAPRSEIPAQDWNRPGLWSPDGGISRATVAGETVSPSRVLTLPTYFACLRNISEDIGAPPAVLRRRRADGRGSDPATDDPRYELAHDRWNPYTSSQAGRELLTSWALGWGLGLAEIQRDGLGRAVALWPIHPTRVTYAEENDEVTYYVRYGLGTQPVALSQRDVYAIHGLGWDGISGYPVAQVMAETFGLGLAARAFASAMFGNDTTLGIVFTAEDGLTDQQYARMKDSLKSALAGARRAFQPFVAERVKVERIGIAPKDAQMIETQRFSNEDLCKILRMPQHMAGILDRATFSNIEHQGIEYVAFTLTPWAKRHEDEFRAKILDDDPSLYMKILFQAYLRGDYVTRTNGYRTLISTGVLTPNEARELEDMNPSEDPGADMLWMQGAMATMRRLAEAPVAPAGPPALPAGDATDGAEKAPESPKPPATDGEADVEARHGLFVDAAQRVIAKEAKATERAVARCDGDVPAFQKWARNFYEQQRADIVNAFGPACEAVGSKPQAWLMEFAADEATARAKRALQAFGGGTLPITNIASEAEALARRVEARSILALRETP